MDDNLAAGMELARRVRSSPGGHGRGARQLPKDGSNDEASMDDVLAAGMELAGQARARSSPVAGGWNGRPWALATLHVGNGHL